MSSSRQSSHRPLPLLTAATVLIIIYTCKSSLTHQTDYRPYVDQILHVATYVIIGSNVLQTAIAVLQRPLTAATYLLFYATITLSIYILLVLCGAPLTTHVVETWLQVLLMSSLHAAPLFHALTLASKQPIEASLNWVRNIDVVRTPLLQTEIASGVVSLLATYAGCFSLALDWEREWQYWPIPNMTACCAAYIVFSAVAYFKGMNRQQHGPSKPLL